MAAEGWLVVDGVEVFSNYRFKQMVDNFQNIGLLDASSIQFNKGGYPTVSPGVKTCPSTWAYNPTSSISNLPWYNAALPESQKLVGFWIEKIEGIDARAFERQLTQKAFSGAQVTQLRSQHRELHFEFVVVGIDSEGVEFGMRWLESQFVDFCSTCSLSTIQLRHNDSVSGDPERGWWKYNRVGLLDGIEWDSEEIDFGCRARRASMTLVAADPCRYKCQTTLLAATEVLASGGYTPQLCSAPEDFILGFDPTIPPKFKKKVSGSFQSTQSYVYAEIPASGIGVNSAVIKLSTGNAITSLIEANGATVTLNGNATGTNNGLVLDGGTGNYASTPDLAAYTPSIIEVVGRVKPTGISGVQVFFQKRLSATEYEFELAADATALRFRRSYNGTTWGVNSVSASGVFTAGTSTWVKVTHNPTTGATAFYKAADLGSNVEPSTWITVTSSVSATGTPYNGTASLNIGQIGSTEKFTGTVLRTLMRNGIGGTLVFDSNFAAGTFTNGCGAAWDIWVTCRSSWTSEDQAIANRRTVLTAIDLPASATMTIDSSMKTITVTQNGIELDHPWQYVAFTNGNSFDWIDCSDCSQLWVGLAPNNPSSVNAIFEVGYVHREGCL